MTVESNLGDYSKPFNLQVRKQNPRDGNDLLALVLEHLSGTMYGEGLAGASLRTVGLHPSRHCCLPPSLKSPVGLSNGTIDTVFCRDKHLLITI